MKLMLFAPELFLLAGITLIFLLSLGQSKGKQARDLALGISIINVIICVICFGLEGELFFKAYKIDLFSQIFKLLISLGLTVVLIFGKDLKGIIKSGFFNLFCKQLI